MNKLLPYQILGAVPTRRDLLLPHLIPSISNISISNKLRFRKHEKTEQNNIRPSKWPGKSDCAKNAVLSRNKFPPSHLVRTSPWILPQVGGVSVRRPVTSPATAAVKTVCICRVQGPCSYWTHGWVVYQFGFILMKDGAHVRDLVSYYILEGQNTIVVTMSILWALLQWIEKTRVGWFRCFLNNLKNMPAPIWPHFPSSGPPFV